MNENKNFDLSRLCSDYLVPVLMVVCIAVSWIHVLHNTDKEIGYMKEQIHKLETELKISNKSIDTLSKEINELHEKKAVSKKASTSPQTMLLSTDSNNEAESWQVTVTAYDLSVNSCGIAPGEEGYGLTASGFDLTGHSLESARAIAVDPDVIPMGSKIMLVFDDEYASQYNGIYTAVDTGGAIIGHRIDLFMGDFNMIESADVVWDFGVRQATATLVA